MPLFSHEWIPAILSSFVQAGREAAGIEGINPGEVFVQGIGLAGSMLAGLMHWKLLYQPAALFAGLFAAFILFFSFCAISCQLALTLMESYIVTGGGVFLLGFGGFHGTVNIAEKYLSYVVAVGVKLFAVSLIVGAGSQLAPLWKELLGNADLMTIAYTPLAIAGSAMLYGIAAWKIPSIAASFVAGSVGFGLQEVIGTTTMASSLALKAAATPLALGSTGRAALGIGMQTARQAGGGVGGAIRGLGTAAGSLTREARNAAVPTLGRAVQNLQKQRLNLGGDGQDGDGGRGGTNP